LRRKQFIAGATSLVAVAGGAIGMAAMPAAAGAKTVTLVGSGSSAAQDYMTDLFAKYSKLHPNIQFSYHPDGGNAGVADVQAGKSEFAIQTAPPSAADSGTVFDELFLDALTIDANSSNSISTISLPTAKDIFLGTDTAWSSVPGSSLTTTIDPVGRNSTAGLYSIFSKAVLGGADQSSNVAQETSDGLVATTVAKDPNAIGYIGLANSTASGIKPLSVSTTTGGKALAPTTANIKVWAKDQAKHKAGGYPLTHFDWAVLPKAKSKQNADVVAFLSWAINSSAAGKVLTKAGAVPYFNK
jgi:phosphate transport system substrate-binding protein